ncbi:MAG: hypothetical protein ACPIOQ_76525, partial [Promethearchaeia archaeon]
AESRSHSASLLSSLSLMTGKGLEEWEDANLGWQPVSRRAHCHRGTRNRDPGGRSDVFVTESCRADSLPSCLR